MRSIRPDLIFLDILLGDGNGFQLLEQLGKTPAQVICTTGLDQHGIRAVKFSPLDYLFKTGCPE
jgi:two-component system LytT family response regulator